MRGATLPSPGFFLALQSQLHGPACTSAKPVTPPASHSHGRSEGPVPQNLRGAGNRRCRKGNAHKRGLFPQSLYRRQTEHTNERVLVGYPNWSWTVVNSLRAEFQTVRRPSFMAHPYCPGFEVLSVCNNRGNANLAAHWGWGRPIHRRPGTPFPR